jgi:hypothetical protein
LHQIYEKQNADIEIIKLQVHHHVQYPWVLVDHKNYQQEQIKLEKFSAMI